MGLDSCRLINWDRRSHRTSDDEVTGPEVLAVPLDVSQDGEGGVCGGIYAPQLVQGLAVLLQPLNGSLQTVREGQRGEGGGLGEFRLRGRRKQRRREKKKVTNVRAECLCRGVRWVLAFVWMLFSHTCLTVLRSAHPVGEATFPGGRGVFQRVNAPHPSA